MDTVSYVSLGENCLIDEILKDFHLRKATFPFGSGRFNIEYIRQICEEDFEHFMDTRFLRVAEVEGKQVVKNDYYSFTHDIYESSVCDGVEFTHHNVFDDKIRESVQRKVDRFKELIDNPKDAIFMYYHRHSEKSKSDVVIDELKKWMEWVQTRSGLKPRMIFLHQEIVQDFQDSNWKFFRHEWGFEVIMYTTHTWNGPERWAAAFDRDLFQEMLNHPQIMEYIYGNQWRQEKSRRSREARLRRFDQLKKRIKQAVKELLQLNKR